MKLPSAAPCFFLVFLFFSCCPEEVDFLFLDREGGRHGLVQEKKHAEKIYRIKKPLRLAESGLAVYITYSSDSWNSLKLYGGKGEVLAEASLFCADWMPYKQLVPLPRATTLLAFSHRSGSPYGDEFKIIESGLTEMITGIERSPGALTIGAGIRCLKPRDGAIFIGFGPEMFGPAGLDSTWQLSLGIQLPGPDTLAEFRQIEHSLHFIARARALISLSGADKRAVFSLKSRPGFKMLYLYPGVIPFRPEGLSIALRRKRGFALNRLKITTVNKTEPLIADPGTILFYDRNRWRRDDFELFSWDRFPEVLILDTSNYRVQDRIFKRLAFFVEKKGFRGRLVQEEEIRNLHGYNAHDYRVLDLARFFSLAVEQGIALNEGEKLLKQILIHNGLIRSSGDSYLPVRGAVISISRSSPAALRQHLLTHECFHGVFFASADYREACFRVWKELCLEEKSFWELFLDWAGYDITDNYLVVNEFQAYLFQQEREGLDYYFKELTCSRLVNSYPERKEEIEAFIKEFPDSFADAFDRLEQHLRETSGMEGGKVIELLPVSDESL